MGYLALLFCPDEKTARTVTQVLGELEFSVEPCLEPFAAVKKLMSQHFDAIVVDCDNEQNATLLFKSARNSTSNQASLAVAVVEGQAGVAKAFRIGANLVLTKPINIEQSKGTLRVARGLLRKGEPAKASTPTAPAPALPAKPAAAKTAPPVKPAPPATEAVAAAPPTAPRPVSAPTVRPAATAMPARVAAASAAPVPGPDRVQAEISGKESVAPVPASHAPLAPSVKLPAPVKPLASTPVSVTPASQGGSIPGFKKTATPAPVPFGSGAASAPAPAREVVATSPAEILPANDANQADSILDLPAEAGVSGLPAIGSPAAESSAAESPAVEAPAVEAPEFVGATPSFTFGGANVPESSGGRKKVLLGLAAAFVIVAALYAGWSYLQNRPAAPAPVQPSSGPVKAAPAPAAAPQPAKPASSLPNSAAPAASTSAPSATPLAHAASPEAANGATGATSPDADDSASPAASDATPKPATSAASPGSKPAKSPAAPLVVKSGTASTAHGKTPIADATAPSVPEIAMLGSSAPPPNLVGGAGSGPAPVLQTMNISQGVSQGLVIKKVQPQYPRNALNMHVEGAVQLMATVSASGNVTAVKILSGDTLLTKAAVDAVKQWKYKPYRLNGEPVEIQTEITVNFALPH